MIHEPFGDVYGQWKAMEEAYYAKKVRALGVSNMYSDRLADFMYHMDVKPAINQIRTHPYFQHIDTKAYMDQKGVVHEAHSPFSQGRMHLFEDPLLIEIATRHHKTVGQVILRWLVQRGIVTLTRTEKKERMIENIDIFDFALTEEEMAMIKTLDRKDGNSFDNRYPEVVERICQNHY